MAEHDLLSHTHAGGQAVWDLMSAQGITWYGAGEIIAYNSTSKLTSSATTAVKGWLGSPPHKAIMLSTQYNYFGLGLAVSPTTGRRYWAGVFLKGPDRTGAWSKLGTVSKHTVSSTKIEGDHPLVRRRHQAPGPDLGLLDFQTQRRVDGGEWYDYGTTTRTSVTKTWTRGHVTEFRVRARDKAGNWGSWKTVKIRT